MPYKIVKKITTPKELDVKGDTAGDFLLDLQSKLPSHPLDITLSNGAKMTLGRENTSIKFSKNKGMSPSVIEQIITKGTKFLLEENNNRTIENRMS